MALIVMVREVTQTWYKHHGGADDLAELKKELEDDPGIACEGEGVNSKTIEFEIVEVTVEEDKKKK